MQHHSTVINIETCIKANKKARPISRASKYLIKQ